MKISNLTALNIVNAMPALRAKKLPMKVAFALFYNLDLLAPQIKAYEEQRKLLEKECEDKEEYGQKIMELLQEEVEVAVKLVPMEELEKIEDGDKYDKLTVAELGIINFMIEN